jgi:hypothetical protein
MYQASRRPQDADVLMQNPDLTFSEGNLTYSLKTGKQDAQLTVSQGANVAAQTVDWAFGKGEVGQTYLFKSGQGYLESRVSYFPALGALGLTIGHSVDVPSSIEDAFGRHLRAQETQACFGCHTTMSTTASGFDPEHAVAGVTCQACHGPGATHIRQVAAGQGHSSSIFNPATLSPAASVDFCGACHRTWADIAMTFSPDIGIIDVRFQPYRLEKSRCWRAGADARITCVACHDPHKSLARDDDSYDSTCLGCHTRSVHLEGGKAAAPVCKVSTAHCVSCHMPKYPVPQAHATFTDHYIRIVHRGDPYPE